MKFAIIEQKGHDELYIKSILSLHDFIEFVRSQRDFYKTNNQDNIRIIEDFTIEQVKNNEDFAFGKYLIMNGRRAYLIDKTGVNNDYVFYRSNYVEINVLVSWRMILKKTKKDLHTDWVFAGSFLDPNPNKKADPFYRANDGDIITVVNFEGACVDVPFLNTKDNDDLIYIPHTNRIPPLKTPVSIVLEPVIAKKK